MACPKGSCGVRGRKDWSTERANIILSAIETTGGQVVKACKASHISLTTFYAWQKAEPDFKAQVDAAIDRSTHVLETEAVRRALAGSDTMLIFLLKARVPDRYRDRQDVRIAWADATPEQIVTAVQRMSDRELDAFERILVARRGTDRKTESPQP